MKGVKPSGERINGERTRGESTSGKNKIGDNILTVDYPIFAHFLFLKILKLMLKFQFQIQIHTIGPITDGDKIIGSNKSGDRTMNCETPAGA